MSEEIKREAELNERELQNVSGGGHRSAGDVMEIRREAISLCHSCGKHPYCSQGEDGMIKYMTEHGVMSVTSPYKCPYFNN